MLGMLIGLLSGMLMSIQGVFNAEVTKQAGVWVAAGFVQLTAFVICVAAWFVTGKEGSISRHCTGKTMVYASWRCHWCIYHIYRHCCDQSAGTCEGYDVYCLCTINRIIYYLIVWSIWHHKSRICMDKTVWHCCNDRRYHAF